MALFYMTTFEKIGPFSWYIFGRYLPLVFLNYSILDDGLVWTEACSVLLGHLMKMYEVYFVLDCYI